MSSSSISTWYNNARSRGNLKNSWNSWSNSWWSHRSNQISRPTGRIKKKACAEWQTDYRKHSLEFGKIIHDVWLAPNRLATCQYRNGKFEFSQAIEPSLGLARAHLVLGYPVAWKLYRRAVAEFSDICTTIKKIINSFENRIISSIDAKTPGYNLQKRPLGYSPEKCEDVRYYIDMNIFSAVFELVQDKIENKPIRPTQKQLVNYNFAGENCPRFSLSLLDGLGSGTDEEVIELNKRIESLVNDTNIRNLVEEYNQQMEKLQTSELKKSYRKAIDNIWTGIRDDGELLKAEGECENIKECRPKP
jgi:hypothetical protein